MTPGFLAFSASHLSSGGFAANTCSARGTNTATKSVPLIMPARILDEKKLENILTLEATQRQIPQMLPDSGGICMGVDFRKNRFQR